ncbi:MAG: hypothetical protein Fur002_00780 [Anaerolineales bacterium]
MALLALMLAGAAVGYAVLLQGRPAPVPTEFEIVKGVTYQRMVHYAPRAMIAHIIIIDRKTKGLQFFVTPPDDVEGGALKARTTSQFLQEFGVSVAINGDGFTPWWSRGLLDYYPHVGDPVTPNGLAASRGKIYSRLQDDAQPKPILYVSRRNELLFNHAPNKINAAISGDRMLLQGGEILPDLDSAQRDPRTAIGTNKNGRWIYLVVIDGRQPFYSGGATFYELAQLMKTLGAFYAMSLDGGGSSTLVIADENGEPRVLNAPIDNYVPLRERAVANHFGVYLGKTGK